MKKREKKVQVNILIPESWKEIIDEKIRKESYENKRNYTFQSYLREYLQREWDLPELEEGGR